MARRIDRRTVLRGAASTVIGLPLLESMLNGNGTALACGAQLPKRLVVFFCPTSLVTSRPTQGSDGITPNNPGTGYDLGSCMQPIGDLGLQDQVSVVSGLYVPATDAPVPGGYNRRNYHGYGYISVFSGAQTGYGGRGNQVGAISADQAVAKASGKPALVYQVDPQRDQHIGISYAEKAGGGYAAVEPQSSPTQAYRNLFTGFTPGSEPRPSSDDLEQRLRLSSLSYAKDQIGALRRRVGANDRRTLDQWFEHVRALELRLAALPEPAPAGACVKPGAITADPAPASGGEADYDARTALFIDLVVAALACDLTRSVAFSMTQRLELGGMVHPLWAGTGGLHRDVQHGGSQTPLQTANRWFVNRYASLLKRLAETKQGTCSLLDTSAAVFLMEGGRAGRAAEGPSDPNHSTDNMVALIAGKAGGLKSGQHVVAKDAHTANVLNSALSAVGVQHEMGDIRGRIDQLF